MNAKAVADQDAWTSSLNASTTDRTGECNSIKFINN